MPKLYPKLSEDFVEKKEVSTGEVVTADHANSKRYFIKDEKPTDDEGFIGDVCFVFNLDPPEPEVLPPFELITGYTIDHVGTSASLVGGQVQFEGVTELSLNNVFTGDYDNYLVVITHASSGNPVVKLRLRLSGADATGTNYADQRITANATTVSGARTTPADSIRIGRSALQIPAAPSAHQIQIYGPALAQPTATRSVSVDSGFFARIDEAAGTHSLSTGYDGVTVFPDADNITGTLSVYGVRS